MNRIFRVSLLLLTVLAMTPSSAALAKAFKLKPFVAPPGEPIKTIALLKIDEPWGYFLGEGGVSSFGLPGLFFSTFKRPKHPEYGNAGFHFSAVAERLLTEHLKAAGFKVISVPVERKKPYQLLRNYKALSVPNVDAYLDVVSGGVGYRQSDLAPDFAQKVGPYVLVSVQLVSAHSKKVLYADSIEYGWRKAHQRGRRGTDIDAPEDQVFANAWAVERDLLSGDRSRSIAQLTQGIDLALRRIVSEFSSYPATGHPLDLAADPHVNEVEAARRQLTPSTTIASASTPYTTLADYERELLRSIAGKWRGHGITVDGAQYFIKYVFREDGSFDYSWSSDTRSDRGQRPPGTLRVIGAHFEHKNPDGRLWTITLHEDKKGRRLLKGRRHGENLKLDGNAWVLKEKK